MIKWKIFSWADYHELFRWAQYNFSGPYKREGVGLESVEEM